MIRGLIYEKKKKVVHMFSPLTVWSWRAEERRRLNAPRHWSPLYGEKRLVDKTVTVCRHCGTRKSNDSGNTSSMATYLKQHHTGVSLTGVKTKAAQQPHITAAIMQPLVAQSDRVKAITNAMGVFIGADMRPNSVKGRKYAFLCCTLSCFSLIMLKRRYYALCTLRWFYIL